MARRSHTPRDSHQPSRMASLARAADSSRAFVPILIFAVIALLFFVRLVYLQIIVAPSYTAQASEARTVGFDIEPRRGTIYDRNGTVLAVSVDATTIYANPSEVEDIRSTAAALASVLGGEAADFESKLSANSATFAFMKRKADVEEAARVKELKLKGVYFIADTRREYPNGQIGGQILGACEIAQDEETGREYYKGNSGLEQYYDSILAGSPGRFEAERGQYGMPIPGGVREETPAIDGEDIMISIDIELQATVEDVVLEAGTRMTAESANSVVMDAATGEILAAASLPLFNPADRSVVEPTSTKLKPVTDEFEPGSIFKSVSAMAILESNTMTPETELFCPAVIQADGYSISDAHERGDATYTLRHILDQSSNVGISLATEQMGFDKLYEYIKKYNLHSKTGIDYPGEGVEGADYLGYMVPFKDLSKISAYNVSFGQGISVTPLQMTRFYGAIANEGVECTPHFLISKPQTGEVPEYATEDVIENKDALLKMNDMLKTVVTEGTGTMAAIDGFNVAGKTSTAEVYDGENGGYKKGVYNMAFTGFLADSSRQLVCFVGANEVSFDHIVTPMFKDIMTSAIDRFRIQPE